MPRRRPSDAVLLGAFAVAGLVVGTLVWLLMVAANQSVRPWLVIALVTVGFLLAGFVHRLVDWQSAAGEAPRPPVGTVESLGGDRYTAGFETYEWRIRDAMADPERFDYLLRPLLMTLAIDRLRTRRGVGIADDPDQARQILGESLWLMMTDTTRRVPSRRQLEEWLTRLEAI